MKKITPLFLLCYFFTTALQAQNLIAKVPATASLVIKYSGEMFGNKMPLQKLDTYSFIKNDFYKLIGIDTLTSLQNIGIDVSKDSYQYITNTDTCMNFVTLFQLKNVTQFLAFIKSSYKKEIKTETKNGFELFAVSDNIFIGWKENVATVIRAAYQNKKGYYDYPYNTTVVLDSTMAVDAIAATADTTATIFTAPKIIKDGYKVPKKTVKEKKYPAKKKPIAKTKKPIKKVKPIDEYIVHAPVVEEKGYDTAYDVAAAPYVYTVQDSLENLRRELWEQQQEIIAKAKQKTAAENIMTTTFTANIISIENELAYKKITDPKADASVWFNYDNLLSQYQGAFFSGASYLFGSVLKTVENKKDGLKSAANVYFENDKIRIDQKTFSEDAAMIALTKEVMNSKQNSSFINYINADNLGYASISVNTEASINYYYSLIKKTIGNIPYMNEMGDLVNIYVDFLQIMIDEKGIADLLPGNYLFVMHGMKTKMVNYTDYSYDSEYNKTEITKTKKELSPDFTFAIETRKEDFMQKLANLPLKYAEKGKYNYKDLGGYYMLDFGKDKYAIDGLYFMVKNGKILVTTSKEVIDMALNNTGYKQDEKIKNSIFNNNFSVDINVNKLMEIFGTKASTSVNKQICAYMKNNITNIKTESGFKDGMIQSTTNVNITGNHNNSLEYIFNIIDNIQKISENDKIEKAKRND